MAETVVGGRYLSQDGVTFHDAFGKVLESPEAAPEPLAEVGEPEPMPVLVVVEPPAPEAKPEPVASPKGRRSKAEAK